MTDEVLNRLIDALAAQVEATAGRTLAPGAAVALADLTRDESRLIFAAAGHDVHYGTDNQRTADLIRLITDVQRPAAGASLRPGDEVHLVQELLPPEDRSGVPWGDGVTYVVRYVGDDGTVDVQPELTEDYVIETVPVAAIRPKAR